MNPVIAKWLLVYVLEHKHDFHVIHFRALTINKLKTWTFGTEKAVKINVHVKRYRFSKSRRFCKKMDFGKKLQP